MHIKLIFIDKIIVLSFTKLTDILRDFRVRIIIFFFFFNLFVIFILLWIFIQIIILIIIICFLKYLTLIIWLIILKNQLKFFFQCIFVMRS